MPSIGIAGERRQVRERIDVGKVGRAHQRRVEEIDRLVGGRRTVARRAGGEIDGRQEDGPRVLLLHEDVVPRLRVPRDALEPDVADGGAELDRLDAGALQGRARDIGEEIRLAVPLLDQHELAAADVGDALGVVELGALRTAAGGERHRVDQGAGLGDLDDRRTAVADDEQRVGVPVVGHRGGFLREQAETVGRHRAGRLGQVEPPDPDVLRKVYGLEGRSPFRARRHTVTHWVPPDGLGGERRVAAAPVGHRAVGDGQRQRDRAGNGARVVGLRGGGRIERAAGGGPGVRETRGVGSRRRPGNRDRVAERGLRRGDREAAHGRAVVAPENEQPTAATAAPRRRALHTRDWADRIEYAPERSRPIGGSLGKLQARGGTVCRATICPDPLARP